MTATIEAALQGLGIGESVVPGEESEAVGIFYRLAGDCAEQQRGRQEKGPEGVHYLHVGFCSARRPEKMRCGSSMARIMPRTMEMAILTAVKPPRSERWNCAVER